MTVPANLQYTNGGVSVTGDNLNTFVQVCNTAPQLRQFVGTPNQSVQLLGIVTANDTLGGTFWWNPASGTTDDNINTLVPPSAASGAWNRLLVTVLIPNLTGGVTSVGSVTTVVTNANLTGGVTSVGNAATVVTNANLTGGVTSVGNTATVVTNANLTGPVTSTGNATTITASGVAAGSYTSSNITISADGRITAAANGTGSGTVTSVATGFGLTGGPITTTGTIAAISTAGGIGTYAFLVTTTGAAVAFGSTQAGSTLKPIGLYAGYASSTSVGAAQAGTWQCMGQSGSTTIGCTTYNAATLWIRIA